MNENDPITGWAARLALIPPPDAAEIIGRSTIDTLAPVLAVLGPDVVIAGLLGAAIEIARDYGEAEATIRRLPLVLAYLRSGQAERARPC